jgi:hypothetical protein
LDDLINDLQESEKMDIIKPNSQLQKAFFFMVPNKQLD